MTDGQKRAAGVHSLLRQLVRGEKLAYPRLRGRGRIASLSEALAATSTQRRVPRGQKGCANRRKAVVMRQRVEDRGPVCALSASPNRGEDAARTILAASRAVQVRWAPRSPRGGLAQEAVGV